MVTRPAIFKWRQTDLASSFVPSGGIFAILSRCACVKKTSNRHAVGEMKVGPSEPPCRRRLQTAISCFGPKAVVVNVMGKRRDFDHVMYRLERRTQVNL